MRRRGLRLLGLSLLTPALLAPAAAGAGVEQLADVHRASSPAEALPVADRLAAEAWAPPFGIDYLRGTLLEALGHLPPATSAFAAAMQRVPLLAPWCRLRLARLQAEEHPEMAAGLLAPALARDLPATLRHQAADLLARTVQEGGDCRLLAGVDWRALPADERRHLSCARAACLRGSDPGAAIAALQAVIVENADDDAAYRAALQLAGVERPRLTPELQLQLGRVFQRQRQPGLAVIFLGPLASGRVTVREAQQREALELLGLAELDRDAYRSAVASFERLAGGADHTELRARALYEEGLARELALDRRGALERYVRAANLLPSQPRTAEALLAACRLQALLGKTGDARQTYLVLRSRREWSARAASAASFLAVQQLASGSVGDAPELLQQATQLLGGRTPELVYWTARADEAQGHPGAALRHYLHLLRELPYHPLTASARLRLAGPAMAPAVRAAVESGRRSSRAEGRLAAWLLLPEEDERREPLRLLLYQGWARDPDLAPYLRLAPVDPAQWPLWSAPLRDAEERLLALDDWASVGIDAVLRQFPLRDPALAFTASQHLAAAGNLAVAAAIAEQLAAPALAAVPPQLLPLQLRATLYPRFAADQVEAAARRAGVDPALLFALMREASRLPPHGVTAWGGRGPLLLDPGAADSAAAAAGLGGRGLDPAAPATAIMLGAVRVAQLQATFSGRPVAIVAAHVAGAAPARLWSSWCATDDPAELLAKLPEDAVRDMVTRVLSAQNAYRELAPVLRERHTP